MATQTLTTQPLTAENTGVRASRRRRGGPVGWATAPALLVLSLAQISCTDDLRTLLFGVDVQAERAKVAAETPTAEPTASAPAPEASAPDPRLRFKLPSGGEASYEYAEAKRLMSLGRWMSASFVLTPKAMGETGTSDELDLLEELCRLREDEACIGNVQAKRQNSNHGDGTDPDELRKLAKSSPDIARTLLLPRLESGQITPDEAAALVMACAKLRDHECEAMAKSAYAEP